jgi:hypothetical protein
MDTHLGQGKGEEGMMVVAHNDLPLWHCRLHEAEGAYPGREGRRRARRGETDLTFSEVTL